MAIQYGDHHPDESAAILDALTPMETSSVPTEDPMLETAMLTIERVGERTEVRWQDGMLQFSPEADGR